MFGSSLELGGHPWNRCHLRGTEEKCLERRLCPQTFWGRTGSLRQGRPGWGPALPFPGGSPTGRAPPGCLLPWQDEATLTIWVPSLPSWPPAGAPLGNVGGRGPGDWGSSASCPCRGGQGCSPPQPPAAGPSSKLFLLRKRYTACGVTRILSSSSTFLILRKLSPALRSSTILLLAWSSKRPIAAGAYIPAVLASQWHLSAPRHEVELMGGTRWHCIHCSGSASTLLPGWWPWGHAVPAPATSSDAGPSQRAGRRWLFCLGVTRAGPAACPLLTWDPSEQSVQPDTAVPQGHRG